MGRPPHAHPGDGRHDHEHDHAPPGQAEQSLGPSHGASVVLDIGPHAGALVVYAPPALAGAEIEIRPGDGEWRGAHTAVRERRVGGGTLYAGVFGSLPAGPYELRIKDAAGHPGGAADGVGPLVVQVRAGSVAEAVLDAGTPPAGARRPVATTGEAR